MAKAKNIYVCQNCGNVTNKWAGKCDACGEWNTITEDLSASEIVPKGLSDLSSGKSVEFFDLDGNTEAIPRIQTDIKEFDRVLGGGLVKGGCILVGGDPGIGKSTILLQAVSKLANMDQKCCYLSGEESVEQIRLRAKRLGLEKSKVKLASTANVKNIIKSVKEYKDIKVVIIDSIQTMFIDEINSAPGTVSQVRTCASELIRLAKSQGFTLFMVGHVTKEGAIAGPRVLEHMVDTVLYFEGDRGHNFRVLRSVKNRFGATNEIGIFEMGDKGLSEVANPSAIFLAERKGNITGSSVFCGIEGSRPILLEIQALVSPSNFGNPKRAVVGWDNNRLSMITAVLETRCGESFSNHDIFLNIAGGLKISEPAADLAVATALLSAKLNVPAPADMVLFGEIGLSGEIRNISMREDRLKEAQKLGFTRAIIPKIHGKKKTVVDEKILQITELGNVEDLVKMFRKKSET